MRHYVPVLWIFTYFLFVFSYGELWEREVGSQMTIGPSLRGYNEVSLKCGAEHMSITVKTEGNFDGVLYTRGSYRNQSSPCFMDAKEGQFFILKIPLNECYTKYQDGVFSNVLILQHDDDLIMPGDAAFIVECDFSTNREMTVSADLNVNQITSKISLTDADPGGRPVPSNLAKSVSSQSPFVSFKVKEGRVIKEEL